MRFPSHCPHRARPTRRKSPFQPPDRHSPYRSHCSVLTPASTPGPLTPDLLVLIRFGVSHAQELRARPYLAHPQDPDLVQQQRASHADNRTTSQVFRFIFPGIRTIHEMKLLPWRCACTDVQPASAHLSPSRFPRFYDLSLPGFHPSRIEPGHSE
ncbi:hypothetical protein BJV77DRAFT_324352 [Russula vinacea]|nr:hypothetical protein BJV77DRAFT_324352 [Russula vinacea]